VFSNSITNIGFILGKLFGTVISFMIAVFLGLLMSILIITIFNKIPISADLTGRLGIFFLLCCVFIFLFAVIGLFVSFKSRSSLKALIVLSLFWIGFTFVIPVFSRMLTSTVIRTQTLTEFEHIYKEADLKLNELIIKYDGGQRGRARGRVDDYKKERNLALALTEHARYKQEIQDNYLREKIHQANFYNSLCNISPIYLFNSIIEDLFNSGIQRDINMWNQAKEYQSELTSFYKEEDRKNPNSPHVHFIGEYFSMSEVDFNQVPIFKEKKPTALDSLKTSLSSFTILLIQLAVLLIILCVLFKRQLIV
jgi:ABC-type transport system involved in multi-copper enzyme maturation permease subunit